MYAAASDGERAIPLAVCAAVPLVARAGLTKIETRCTRDFGVRPFNAYASPSAAPSTSALRLLRRRRGR